ncbi:hypothetical protein ACIOEX_01220 [Streptomyces sp. NPDC087850]|uniref:hypothetical protein n=1 Tax=Streptomyces sp. NPDC087850 TaxID=3365809 RepID=UPI0037F8ADC2
MPEQPTDIYTLLSAVAEQLPQGDPDKCAVTLNGMSRPPATRPYTDADLRAEAAWQHAGLTEDPDFGGVGEQMEDRFVRYEVVDADHGGLMPAPGSPRWSEAGEGEFDKAQRKIHDLIDNAADVSEWAVDLGADGLEPDGHTIQLGAIHGTEQPAVRMHFAFHSDMAPADRDRYIVRLTQVISDHL